MRRWQYNIKMDLTEIVWEIVDWVSWLRIGKRGDLL